MHATWTAVLVVLAVDLTLTDAAPLVRNERQEKKLTVSPSVEPGASLASGIASKGNYGGRAAAPGTGQKGVALGSGSGAENIRESRWALAARAIVIFCVVVLVAVQGFHWRYARGRTDSDGIGAVDEAKETPPTEKQSVKHKAQKAKEERFAAYMSGVEQMAGEVAVKQADLAQRSAEKVNSQGKTKDVSLAAADAAVEKVSSPASSAALPWPSADAANVNNPEDVSLAAAEAAVEKASPPALPWRSAAGAAAAEVNAPEDVSLAAETATKQAFAVFAVPSAKKRVPPLAIGSLAAAEDEPPSPDQPEVERPLEDLDGVEPQQPLLASTGEAPSGSYAQLREEHDSEPEATNHTSIAFKSLTLEAEQDISHVVDCGPGKDVVQTQQTSPKGKGAHKSKPRGARRGQSPRFRKSG